MVMIMLISVLTGVTDVISSYMGMNVKIPGDDKKNYIPFAVIMTIICVLTILLYIILRCLRFMDF